MTPGPDKLETSVYEINEKINIPARLDISESSPDEDKSGQDYIDITVNVISTNITGNGRQYAVEDLHLNSERLNESGGLIFAMGKHPKDGEEPDASDHVGIGMTCIKNDVLTSRARVYNTATHPDIVQNIKRKLVRDVSIEGFVRYYKRTCKEGKCWQRAIGLHILRATFVSSGADPAAKIIDIFESIDRDNSREITMDEKDKKQEIKTEGAGFTAKPEGESKEEHGTSGEHAKETVKQETTEAGKGKDAQNKQDAKPKSVKDKTETKTKTGPEVNASGTDESAGASQSDTSTSAHEADKSDKEEKDKTESKTSARTEESHKPVIEAIDPEFKTNVLSSLSSIEKTIAESKNPKEYTKSQIKNMLEYLKQNSGMADEDIKDTFYQCASKLSDKDHVKHALTHLGENPGMVDDDMRSIMKKLVGVSESEKAPDKTNIAESEGVPDETNIAESGNVKVTETGDGEENTGKRIVESPSSPPVTSTFTEEVRKHVR